MLKGIEAALRDFKPLSDQEVERVREFAERIGGVHFSLEKEHFGQLRGISYGSTEYCNMTFNTALCDTTILVSIVTHTFADAKTVSSVFYNLYYRDLWVFGVCIEIHDIETRFMRRHALMLDALPLKNFMHSDNRVMHFPKFFKMIEYLSSINEPLTHIVGWIEQAITVFTRMELEDDNERVFYRTGTQNSYFAPITFTGRDTASQTTADVMFVDIELETV